MVCFACKRFNLEELIKCGLGISKTDYKIIRLLLESGEVVDSKIISSKLEIDLSTAQRSLKKLRELELVKRQQVNLTSGGYNLKYSAIEKEKIIKLLEDTVDDWTKKVKKEISGWA